MEKGMNEPSPESAGDASVTQFDKPIENSQVKKLPGMAPSFIDLSTYTYLETRRVSQRSQSSLLDYTVKRSIRLASLPNGLAHSYSLLLPDPAQQRVVDSMMSARLTQVSSIVSTLPTLSDPNMLLDSINKLIADGVTIAPAFRLLPVTGFSVIENGRRVVPAWPGAPASVFQLANLQKADPAVASYIERFNNVGQFACLTDTTKMVASVSCALRDFVIANIIKRTAPHLSVWCIDPQSVDITQFNPRWIEIQSPYNDDITARMAQVKRILVSQLNKELAALPPTEAATDPRARILYALRTLEFHMESLEGMGDINVYCQGLVPERALYTMPAAGTQAGLLDMATALEIINHLRRVHAEVFTVRYDDPSAPEPYIGDLYGQYLDFAARMIDYVGTDRTKCAIAGRLHSTALNDRYMLSMEMAYWEQTYLKGSLDIGGQQIPLLIPDYGLTSRLLMKRAISQAVDSAKEMIGFGEFNGVRISLQEVIGSSRSLDPTRIMDLPFRTTESPLALCEIEERFLSPYLISALQDPVEVSTHFQHARSIFFEEITPYSYVGGGFTPYKRGGSADILLDTAMFRFDDAMGHYLKDVLGTVASDDPFAVLYGLQSVYIPLGSEGTRRGGLTFDNVNTYYCIRITNPAEEMTLTGPAIVEWTPDVQELLQWEAVSPIARTTGPYTAR